jgi:uncharacterized delta-60 repeat protein
MKRIVSFLLLFTSFHIFTSSPTDLDTTFNLTGYNTELVSEFSQKASGLALANTLNNLTVVAGYAYTTQNVVALVRYQENGAIDTTFGTDGIVTTVVGTSAYATAIAIHETTGGIFVTGCAMISGIEQAIIIKYNANGTIDTNFGVAGIITLQVDSDEYYATKTVGYGIALDSNDNIVICGYTSGQSNQEPIIISFVARYSSAGVIDTNFIGNGYTTFNLMSKSSALVIAADNTIIVTCNYLADDMTTPIKVGLSVLTDVITNSTTIDLAMSASDIILDADENYSVTGTLTGSPSSIFIARWLAQDNTLDPNFGDGTSGSQTGYTTFSLEGSTGLTATNIDLVNNNKLLVTGFVTLNNVQQIIGVRFTTSGTLDTDFSSDGYISNTISGYQIQAFDATVTADSKFLIVGQYTDATGIQGIIILRCLGENQEPVLDTAFNGTGYNADYTEDGTQNAIAYATAIQSDGKIITAGSAYTNQQVVALCRYNTDGTVDETFGIEGYITTAVGTATQANAILILEDDSILIAGYATINNVQQALIVKYDSEGALDTNFGTDGIVTDEYAGTATNTIAYDIKENSDGYIYIVGQSAFYGFIAAYTADGQDSTLFTGSRYRVFSLESSNTAGVKNIYQANSLQIVGNNNCMILYTNTNTTATSPSYRVGIIKVVPGSYNYGDTIVTFKDSIPVSSTYPQYGKKLITDANGYLVGTGYFTANDSNNLFIARWSSAGVLTTSFNATGCATYSDTTLTDLYISQVNQINDDKYLVTGYATKNNVGQVFFARYDNNGIIDTTFGTNGATTQYFSGYNVTAHATTLEFNDDENDKIIVAGQFTQSADTAQKGIIIFRYLPESTEIALDTDFNNSGYNDSIIGYSTENAKAQKIALQSTGSIITAGSATTDQQVIALARYLETGALDTSFGSEGTGKVVTSYGIAAYANAIAINSDDTIYIAGSTKLNDNLWYAFIAKYSASGVLDTSFGTNGDGFVTLQASSPVTGYTSTTTMAYDLIIDTLANKLVMCGYTAGYTETVTFSSLSTIARYNLDGTTDTTFNNGGWYYNFNGNTFAPALVCNDSGKYILITNYVVNNSYSRDNQFWLTEITAGTASTQTTALAYSIFNTDDNYTQLGTDIVIDLDGKYCVTGEMIPGDESAAYVQFVTRWNVNGTLDTTNFNTPLGYNTLSPDNNLVQGLTSLIGLTIHVTSDNKIMVTGVAVVNGINNYLIIQYKNDGTYDPSFNTSGVLISTVDELSTFTYNSILVNDDLLILGGQYQSDTTTSQGIIVSQLERTQAVVLDETFNGSGYNLSVGSAGSYDASGNSTAIQSTGKIVVAGNAYTTKPVVTLTRYNTDGSLDETFGDAGIVITAVYDSAYANAVAIDSNDRIIVVGQANSGSNKYALLLCYDEDGTLDPSFSSDGIVTAYYNDYLSLNKALDIKIQSDNKIVIVGTSWYYGFIARYNTDGTIDTSFGYYSSGYVTILPESSTNPSSATSVVIANDGSFGILMSNTDVSSQQIVALKRYSNNGQSQLSYTSTTFNNSYAKYPKNLIIDENGKFVATGYWQVATNDYATFITRWTSAGALDTTFNGSGYASWYGGDSLATRINQLVYGYYLLTGYTTDGDVFFAQYDNNGAITTSFGSDGTGTMTQSFTGYSVTSYGTAVTANDNLVVCGQYTLESDTTNKGIIISQYLPQNSAVMLDTSFSSNGYSIDSEPDLADTFSCNAIAQQSTGKTITAGGSTSIDQNTSQTTYAVSLTRYNTNGSLDNTFGYQGFSYPYLYGTGNTLAIYNDTTKTNSGYLDNLDKMVVAGSSRNSSNYYAWLIARYNPNLDGTNGLDTTFNGNGYVIGSYVNTGYNQITSAAIQNDGKIVVVGITSETSDGKIQRYTSSGALDSSFGTNGTTTFGSEGCYLVTPKVAIDSNNLAFLICQWKISGNASTSRLFKLQSNGKVDTSFNNNTTYQKFIWNDSNATRDIVIQRLYDDNKPVVVGVTFDQNQTVQLFITRCNSTGTYDTSFGDLVSETSTLRTGYTFFSLAGSTSLDISSVNLFDNNKILVIGHVKPSGSSQYQIISVCFNVNGTLDTTFNGGLGYQLQPISGYDLYTRDAVINENQTFIVAGTTTSNTGEIFISQFESDTNDLVLDTQFNNDGYNTTDVSLFYDNFVAYAIKTQSDGKIVAAGSTVLNGQTVVALTRYNTDGTIDTSFGVNGYTTTAFGTTSEAYDLTISDINDGTYDKIYITGYADDQVLFARYTINGSLDTTSGFGTNGSGYNITEDGIGKSILVNATNIFVLSQSSDQTLVRLLHYELNGTTLDVTRINGVSVGSSIDPQRLAFLNTNEDHTSGNSNNTNLIYSANDSNGTIVLTSYIIPYYTTNTTNPYYNLYAIDFGFTYNLSTDIAIQSYSNVEDNMIIMTGTCYDTTDAINVFVARYNIDTTSCIMTLDTSFGQNSGYTLFSLAGSTNLSATSVQIDSNNAIIVSGYVTPSGSTQNQLISIGFTEDGQLDTNFNNGSTYYISGGLDDYQLIGNDSLLDSEQRIVAAGSFSNNLSNGIMASRYAPGTSTMELDLNFDTDGYNTTLIPASYTDINIFAIAQQSTGYTVAAGQAEQEGIRKVFLTRYTSTGEVDTTFGDEGVVLTQIGSASGAYGLTITDGSDGTTDRIYIAGYSDNQILLARYTSNGSLDTTSGFGTNGSGYNISYLGVGTSVLMNATNIFVLAQDSTQTYANLYYFNTNGTSCDAIRQNGVESGQTIDPQKLNFLSSNQDNSPNNYSNNTAIIYSSNLSDNTIRLSAYIVPYFTSGDNPYYNLNNITFGYTYNLSSDIAVQSYDNVEDNQIIMTGICYNTTDAITIFVARYNINSTTCAMSLDTSFGSNGFTLFSLPSSSNLSATSVNIFSDNSILVGGYVTPSGSTQSQSIAIKYTIDGDLDYTFNHGYPYKVQPISTYQIYNNDGLINADQSYLLAGNYLTTSANQGAMIAQFDTTAIAPALDQTFDDDGYNTTQISGEFQLGESFAMTTQFDEDYIITAGQGYLNEQQVIVVARYFNDETNTATDGTLDGSFGNTINGGYATTAYGQSATAAAVAVDNSNRIIAAGTTIIDDVNTAIVVRYKSDGTLDTSFGSDGIVTTLSELTVTLYGAPTGVIIHDVAIQSDGNILVIGTITYTYNSAPLNLGVVICYNATDGSLNANFGDPDFGSESGGFIHLPTSYTGDKLAFQTISETEYIITLGTFTLEEESTLVITRLSPTGYIDTSEFGDYFYGYTTYDQTENSITTASDIIVDSNHKIVSVGNIAYTDNTENQIFISRLNSDGSYDTSFANNSTGSTTFTIDGAENLQAVSANFVEDGAIVITGSVTIDETLYILAVRYTSAGELDYSFSGSGYITQAYAGYIVTPHDSIVLNNTSKFSITGEYVNDYSSGFWVSRYLNNYDQSHILDPEFNDDGYNTTNIGGPFQNPIAYNVKMQRSANLVVAGKGTANTESIVLARYLNDGVSDGILDTSFGSSQTGYTVTSLADYDLAAFGMAIYNNNSEDNSTYDEAIDTIIVVGQAVNADDGKNIIIGKYSTDGILDENFQDSGLSMQDTWLGNNDAAYNVAIQSDAKFVVVGTTNGNGLNYNTGLIARYTVDGELDTSTASENLPFGSTGYILTQPSGTTSGEFNNLFIDTQSSIYAFGTFVSNLTNPTQSIVALYKFNNDGTLNQDFGDTINGELAGYAILTFEDQAFAADLFVNPTNNYCSVVGTYYPNENAEYSSIFVARFNEYGELDTTFAEDGVTTLTIDGTTNLTAKTISIGSDGMVIVTGSVFYENMQQIIVARFLDDGSLDTTFTETGWDINTIDGYQITPNNSLIQPDLKFVITGSYLDAQNTQGIIISRYLGGDLIPDPVQESHNELPVVAVYGFNVNLYQEFLYFISYAEKITNLDARTETIAAMKELLAEFDADHANESNFDYMSNLYTIDFAPTAERLISNYAEDPTTQEQIVNYFLDINVRILNLTQNLPS